MNAPFHNAMEPFPPELRAAHVIVVANEKGGAGKSTVSMHLAVALQHLGHSVVAVDLDSRQLSLNRYWENRERFAAENRIDLPMPLFRAVRRGTSRNLDQNEIAEFSAFAEIIGEFENSVDFILIDTPGTDSYLMRLSHSIADTLVTPMNDSFIDVDVVARVASLRDGEMLRSQYAEIVHEARRKRRMVDGGLIDWVLVRNRLSSVSTVNEQAVGESLSRLADAFGFRMADGLQERVVFRELYPFGLTVLDVMSDERLGIPSTAPRKAAADEVWRLVETLDLPLHNRETPRIAARNDWFERMSRSHGHLRSL